MAVNGFVNFGDIKGESTDKDHKDWVSVAGYHESVTRPSWRRRPGGRARRRSIPSSTLRS